MFKNQKNKEGFSLFIAVVVTGILLLVSYFVSNIATRQVYFSTSGRESQYAIFAAEAGIECALYWDSKFDPSKFSVSTDGSPISCLGATISTDDNISGTTTTAVIGGEGDGVPSVFGFSLAGSTYGSNACVVVTVTKDGATTEIDSRGYNTCDINNSRRVERGIKVRY